MGLPGIVYWAGDSRDFTLVNSAGQIVPATVGDNLSGGKLLVPQAPLVADSEYRITYKDPCGATAQDGAATRAFTFRTSADAPLPTTLGTLSTQEKTIGTTAVADSCGDTGERKPAASVTLTITPSAELVPWLPLTEVTAALGKPGYGVSVRLEGGKLVVLASPAFCDGTGPIKPEVQDMVVSGRVSG
ncbi:MAG: hypothetical protein JWN04_1569, partial [Myxococcaceae bacterium]|nr:hypothetical protein [Myxococcaceae bacterium]